MTKSGEENANKKNIFRKILRKLKKTGIWDDQDSHLEIFSRFRAL